MYIVAVVMHAYSLALDMFLLNRGSNWLTLAWAMVLWVCTLKHAPMFKRVKLWKKHKGSIPALGQGGGGAGPRGQAAAIIRKGKLSPGALCW